jgi:hypothetical protein
MKKATYAMQSRDVATKARYACFNWKSGDLEAAEAAFRRALETLREAVDLGWKYSWRWHLGNKSLDSIRGEPGFEEVEAKLERETAEQLEAIRALPDMGEFDLRNRSECPSLPKTKVKGLGWFRQINQRYILNIFPPGVSVAPPDGF